MLLYTTALPAAWEKCEMLKHLSDEYRLNLKEQLLEDKKLGEPCRTLQKTMARLWAHLSVIYAAECTGCSVHSQLAWNTGSVAAQAARVEPKVSGQTTDSVKKEDKTLSNTECLMTE